MKLISVKLGKKYLPGLLPIMLALIVASASANIITLENGQVDTIGGTASVNMILDSAPDGLAGYSINLTVGDPSVAIIDSVSFPAWALSGYKENSTLPASLVKIRTTDTSELVQAGATNINLATVTLKGLKGGVTPVTVTLNLMNDDNDAVLHPTIQSGTFTVDVPVAPVAAFTATPTNLDVQFTDQSTNNPTSWSWDFGDSTPLSTAQSPSHTYAAAGTYSVTLTATNAAGSNAHTESVTVSAAPVTPAAAFSANVTSGDAPLAVQFTDSSTGTGPLTYAWDFNNDGTVDSVARNPVHLYSIAGSYTVNLTVTNAAGSNSHVESNYITVNAIVQPPVANFNKNISSGPAPLAVQFTDTSTGGTPTSWAWDFQNDGTIDSTIKDPVFIYTAAGTYAVNLTVANAGGSNSRVKTGFIAVTSPGSPPVTDFSADNRSGLAPLTVHFSDLSSGNPTSWTWDLNNDGTIESIEQDPVYTYANPGTYQVNLTATNAFGSNSRLRGNYIIVSASGEQNPVVDFSASPQTGAAPLTVHFTDLTQTNPTSWAWDFQNDHVIDSTEQNPTFTFTTPGTYQVNLTATNVTGTSSRLKVNGVIVTAPSVTAPVAAFSADHTSGAAPLAVQFTDESTNTPTSWAWDFNNDGTIDTTAQNPAHTFALAGTYTVNLTVSNAAGNNFVTHNIVVTSQGSGGLANTAWPKYQQNTNNTGQSPYLGPQQASSPAWTFHTDQDNDQYMDMSSQPVIGSDGTLYFGASNRYFYAFFPNGTQKWSYPTLDVVIGSAAIDADGTIYFGASSSDCNFYALNPDGTLKWSYADPNGGFDQGSPTIATDGTIYVGDNNGNFLAFDPNGTLKWQDTTYAGHPIYGTPAIAQDGTIYLSNSNMAAGKNIFAYDPDGTVKWSKSTGFQVNPSISLGPDGTLYASSNNGKLYALNPDGTEKWSIPYIGNIHYFTAAVSNGGTIYVGSGSHLYAVNPSGTVTWDFPTGGDNSASAAIGADGTIYFGSADTKLYAINPDGSQKWSYTTGGAIRGAPTIGPDGSLYIESQDNNLYAFHDPAPATVPVANFTAAPTSGISPLTVSFSDTSSNSPTAWQWNFGDGSANGTDQNPSHVYASGGTYSVTLTASNANGSGTTVRSDLIIVNSTPTLYFVPDHQSIPLAGTVDYTIMLDGVPQGLTGYDFVADLTTPDVAQITKVTYPAWAEMTQSPTVPANSVRLSGVDPGYQVQPGAKNVALGTITLKGIAIGFTPIRIGSMHMDGDDANTFTVDQPAANGVISVVAQNSPVAVFSANTTSGRAPLDVKFTDASTGTISTWAWEFGDDTTSTEQSPEHSYSSVGQYTVKLTVSGPGGSNSVVKTSYITVNADGPVAGFTMSPTSGVAPLTVQFNDTSSGPVTSWAWNFGVDASTDSATQNPTYIFSTPGTYTVTLTATGPGGSSTTTQPITISAGTPVARFAGAPTTGIAPLTVQFNDASLGNITAYTWAFGDGSTSTQQNPSYTYNSAGTYNVTLTVTGPGGSDSVEKIHFITLGGLTADFSANVTHGVASRNVSFPVAFTDLSMGNPVNPTSWNWSFGNGATSTLQNPVEQYSGRPRNFTVTLSSGNGIDNSAKTRVDYIQITPYLEAFPGHTILPTNPNGYYGPYVYEDVNGNGRLDYADIVTYFQNKQWISDNNRVDIENYDYNFNGAIDYNDVIRIYWDVLNSRS